MLFSSVPGRVHTLFGTSLKMFFLLQTTNPFGTLISGCIDCNKEENILLWQRFMKPRIVFGVLLEEIIGGEQSVSRVVRCLLLHFTLKT